MPDDSSPTLFARTNARRPFRGVFIKQADRFSHMYVIGKTGVGKTTLLETLVRQDLAAGHGCALIDPHTPSSIAARGKRGGTARGSGSRPWTRRRPERRTATLTPSRLARLSVSRRNGSRGANDRRSRAASGHF